jgi:hypothetical protein
MSTRTLIDIKLEVTEPEQLSEDLIFTLSTDGASEQVDSDVALTYASQIDAMLGDSHTVEVAIATSLFERQQAVVAAAQADAAALAERLTSLGAKVKAPKATTTRRPRTTKADAEDAAAPAAAEQGDPAPAAVTDMVEPGSPTLAAVTDVAEPGAPSTDQGVDDVPPADVPPADVPPAKEPQAEDEMPAAEPVAEFYVPAPGPDGSEDVTEF